MRARTIAHATLYGLMFSFCIFVSSAYSAEFTVTPLAAAADVAAYEVSGNYDAALPGATDNLSRQLVTREFYATHQDDYDFLVIFTNFDFQMPWKDANALYQGVQNDVQGIGLELFDNSSLYGSNSVLQGIVDMGNVSAWATDPLDPDFSETMGTLSHELLHRWSAYVSFKKADNTISTDLLGHLESHWSFLLDTDGSLQYGNQWQDNGDGNFTSLAGRRYLSPLDMYLMGLIDKSEVPPMLLIENPDIDPQRLTEPGITIEGTPRYVTISDIIAAEGERFPGVAGSQKDFKIGAILLTRPGTFSETDLAQVRVVLQNWPLWFSALTNGKVLVDFSNTPGNELPANPGIDTPPLDPRTAPAEINDGVAWLLNNQQENGSWQDSLFTADRDTATVLAALANYSTAASAIADGVAWLENAGTANLDYLARKTILLSSYGLDASAFADEILARQNPDGGWGTDTNISSSPADTALALQALSASGTATAQATDPAIDYLLAAQNNDSGWGTDGNSNVLTTIDVITAFIPFYDQYPLGGPVQNAVTWLSGKQNPDGGFGNSPSTIYSTAKTLIALKQLGNETQAADSALNYILSNQEQDGSWRSSAYQTALAINSIWTASRDPDLVVNTADISLYPSQISLLPTDLDIRVVVRNTGKTDVEDVQVALYEGAIDASSKIGEQSISVVHESTSLLTFNTTITNGDTHHYIAVVDPDNLVKESSEKNNSAMKIVYPSTTFDFTVTDGSLAADPAAGSIFEPLAITAKATNRGTADAYSVPIHLVADDGAGPNTVSLKTMDLPAGETVEISFTWAPVISGAGISLSLKLDPDNAFPEVDENNNTATLPIDINISEKPDLLAAYTDISFSPFPALEGGHATIQAIIRNRGFSPAANVEVHFYDGVPGEENSFFIGSATIQAINAGESATAVFDWKSIPVSGERVITVVADPSGSTDEVSEDNNSAFQSLLVLSLPDFAIDTNSISFNPSTPKEGDLVTVSTVVHNRGEQPASNVPVAFYEEGALIESVLIPEFPTNSQATATVAFNTSGKTGVRTIEVVVDPDSSIPEQDKANNKARKSLSVQNSNLWLSENYISPNGDGVKDSTKFSCRLAKAQDVSVAVANEDGETVREYTGPGFQGAEHVSITWDGLDNKGRVVADGQYQVQVLAQTGTVLSSLLVTVDNNLSPLIEAIGTPYLFQSKVYDFLTEKNWQWLPGDSGIIFHIEEPNAYLPEYPTGLYTMSPTGDDITRIVPEEWNTEFSAETGYRFKHNSSDCQEVGWHATPTSDDLENPGFSVADDGLSIAFILERYNKPSGQTEQTQLWTVNRFGEGLTLLASFDNTETEQIRINDIFWSPDAKYIAYMTFDQISRQQQITIVDSYGSTHAEIPLDPYSFYAPIDWSPDSKHIAFPQNGRVSVADISGNIEDILPVGEKGTYIDWFDRSRILIRDYVYSSNFQNVWIVDIHSGAAPKLIAEEVYAPRVVNPQSQCIGNYDNSPLMESGHFVAGYDPDSQPFISYKVCDADGECQDSTMWAHWWTWANYSLNPDGSKFVINYFFDSSVQVFDLDTLKTDVDIIGDYYCNYDWDAVYDYNQVANPDKFSLLTFHHQDTECDPNKEIWTYHWNWLDNETFLAEQSANDGTGWVYPVIAYNINTRKITFMPPDWDGGLLRLSPEGRYISYTNPWRISSKVLYTNINSSLLNLTAVLRPSKTESEINFLGIATDLNFANWKLEYADKETPDDWRLINFPSDRQVVEKNLASWVPPYEGAFLVRLTVTDKAGNSSWDRKVVTWGKKFSVTNFSKTGELFSPNSDGVKDTVGLSYTVNEPVHLEFLVRDENGDLVKTFYRDYALPGEYGIVWDGTNEFGGIVADGEYSIQLFDHEFFFEVDNTLPDTELNFSSLRCGGDSAVMALLHGAAVDANLKSWALYSGEGDNPPEWHVYKTGTENNYGETFQSFTPDSSPSIGTLSYATYRLAAEDYAGNQNEYLARTKEEMPVIYLWDGLAIGKVWDEKSGKNISDFKKNAQGLCESGKRESLDFLDPGTHNLSITETIHDTIVSATVQYRMHMQWHDAETVLDPPESMFVAPFDTTGLDLDNLVAVRVKLTDDAGKEYLTNNVPFLPQTFTASADCIPKGSLLPPTLSVKAMLLEDLVAVKVQATKKDGVNPTWEDVAEYDLSIYSYPYTFYLHDPPEGYGYPMQVVGVGESGQEYFSSPITATPGQCPDGADPEPPKPCATILRIDPGRISAPCNSINYGVATIGLEYCPIAGPQVLPDQVRYYLEENGEARLLKQFDFATEGWGKITLQTGSIAEGKHPVRADLVYAEKVIEGFRTNTLTVDRTLPETKITYPSPSAQVCPLSKVDDKGATIFYVNVEGVVADDNSVEEYSISYGQGDNPDRWTKSAYGKGARQGSLGEWEVTDLNASEYSLKLKATDGSGNSSCFSTRVTLDKYASLNASTDRLIFSPNGDNIQDKVSISYTVNENANLTVSVYNENGSVRTLAADQEISAGTGTIAWDGRNNNGVVQADGEYQIVVSIVDSCGNASSTRLPVTVDNTPPTTIITSPEPWAALDIMTEIIGTVSDSHLDKYELHVRDKTKGTAPELLGRGFKDVENFVLAAWNTFELTGDWSIILSAEDRVGNRSEAVLPISFGERPDLISNLDAEPGIFSPNNDGKVDSTLITYELTAAANTAITFKNSLGATYLGHIGENTAAGTHIYTWTGGDEGGSVPDGEYTASLTAESVTPPYTLQTEEITIIKDATAPAITITSPLDASFHPEIVDVQATLQDLTLNEYNAIVTGDQQNLDLYGAASNGTIKYSTSLDFADGIYTLRIDATDSAENASSESVSFTVDKTSPKITLESPAAGDYFGGSQPEVTVKGIIEEVNLQSYSVQYASAGSPEEWFDIASGEELQEGNLLETLNTGQGQTLADGEYTIRVTAIDKVAWESEIRVSIHVDNTPPELAISTPAQESYATEAFDITGSVTDAFLLEYSVEIAGSECSTASGWTLLRKGTQAIEDGVLMSLQALPPDGAYCIRLSAVDKLNNVSEVKTDITVDTTPPAPPELSGNVEAGTGIALAWQGNAEPDLAGYNLYRDNEKINAVLIEGTTFLDQEHLEGEYTYTVRGVDFAGLESVDSNPVTLTVDFTPPEAQIHSPRDGFVAANYVDITGRAFSKDDFMEYRVYYGMGEDPSTWVLLRKSPVPISYGVLVRWDVLSLDDGPYSIKLEAEDLNGNINEQILALTVDNTPPAAPVLLAADPTGSQVDLSWQANAESDLAGYLVFRNGQLANESGTVLDLQPYLLTALNYRNLDVPDGTHDYYLAAMDNAGNMSDQSNIISVEIDNHAPHLKITAPTSGSEFDKTIFVKAESEDTDIATVQFQYQPSGAATWTNLGRVLTQPQYAVNLDPLALDLAYGSYRLRAVATDLGGLTDTQPEIITVHFTDVTPPVTPTGLRTQVNGGFITLSWNQNQETDLAGYNVYLGSSTVPRNAAILTDITFLDPASNTSGYADGEYGYTITAVDASGNESEKAPVTATVFTPVLDPPAPVATDSTISVTGGTIPDASVEIFSSIEPDPQSLGVAQADANGQFSLDIVLTGGSNTLYAVATDTNGNISRPSDTIVLVYDTPPAQPTGLAAVVNGYDVSLSWDANTESDLFGYNLYRNGEKINTPELITSADYYASAYSANAYLAADGDPSTYWSSPSFRNTFGTAYWDMYFATPQFITSVEIEWGGVESARLLAGKDYQIRALTGGVWKTVAQVSGNSAKVNTHTFAQPVIAERIRIYVTGTTDYYYYKIIQIAEVRIVREPLIPTETYDDLSLSDGKYAYQVSAVDTSGSESVLSEKVVAVVGDVIPPAVPLNLLASATGPDVALTWSANPETDLAGYNIYRTSDSSWQKVNSSPVSTTTYSDTGVKNGTYTYRVTAVDETGNESEPSNESSVEILTQLPEPPTNLVAEPSPEGGAVDVCWEGSADQVNGYLIYRSLISGGPYEQISSELPTASCYHDPKLTNGTEYFYVVRSVDSTGNESVDSNEDSAIPQDGIKPEKPVLLFPTVSGRPYQSPVAQVDVIGQAEPGSFVDLIHDEAWIDTVGTSNEQVHESVFLTNFNVYETIVTPDGKSAYYVLTQETSYPRYYYTFNKDLTTGVETLIDQIPEGSWDHQMSPDGTKIAYNFENEAWWIKVGVYDITTGTAKSLTTDDDCDEYEPAWSGDSTKIVFDCDKGDGFYDMWVHDVTSGETARFTQNHDGYYPELSHDGQKVVFNGWDSINRQQSLFLVDSQGEAPVVIADDIDWSGYYPSVEWSPLDNRIAFTTNDDGNYDIYILDTDTGGKSRLTNTADPEISLQWSPDGKYIAYYVETGSGIEFRMISANGQAGEILVHSSEEYIDMDFNWQPSGIFYRLDSDLQRITMPGTFIFKDVGLNPGQNIFSARAVDAAGNASEPADEIIVNIDAGFMPDIEIQAQDIFILPGGPIAGDNVTLGAAIRNRSSIPVENVQAEIYIWDTNDTLQLIHTATIPYLAQNTEGWISANWDSTGMAGLNTVFILLDPFDDIAESQEDNNLASSDFYVADGPGISFDAALNGREFSADEIVNITAEIHNRGPNRDIQLIVQVEDGNGVLIEELTRQDIPLAYDGSERIELQWNAGSVFAGAYRFRAALHDTAAGQIAEKVLPFTVLPDIDVSAFLKANKAQYAPNEDVALTLTVANRGTNEIIPELSATTTLYDAAGDVLNSEEHALFNLLPESSAEINTHWNTGTHEPGSYTVSAGIMRGNETVATSSTDFAILSSVDISGNLTVEPKVLDTGGKLTAGFNIANNGNGSAQDILLKLTVINAATSATITSHELYATLETGEAFTGSHVFAEQAWEPGTYKVMLQSLYQGEQKNLDSDTFTARDVLAPSVTVQSPADGSAFVDSFDITAIATDEASGVANVEYQVDNGSWMPLPLINPVLHKYGTRWLLEGAEEGAHVFAFRATDKAGNVSVPVVSHITIEADVQLTVATDKTSYTINENVIAEINLINSGLQKDIRVIVNIETQQGDLVEQVAADDITILAEESRTFLHTWNTGATYAGNYHVRVRTTKNGTVIAEKTAPFIIEKALVLNGSLTMSGASSVPIGDDVTANWSVTNNGNFDLSELAIEHILFGQDNAQIMNWPETVTLAKGQTVSGSNLIQTGDIGLGSYSVALKAAFETANILLAEAQFDVVDITAPVMEITSPTDGTVVEKPVEVAAQATDDASGVDAVEYRIDQGDWLPLLVKDAATGTYSAVWTPVETDEGDRTVSFRATDKSGNVSEPVVSSITVQPKVDLTAVTDKASYAIHEDMAVNIDLRNIGWLKNFQMAARIENALGETVAELASEALVLAIDEQRTIKLSWNTATEYAGSYKVHATLTRNGVVLTETTIPFVIEKALILDGSLTLSETAVPVREAVTANWTVTNNGNIDLSELVIERILFGQDNAQLMSWPETVALAKGQTTSGSDLIQTSETGLGSYSIALKAAVEAEDILLAEAQFEVIDITPPVVSITSPADGTIVESPVEVAAQVTDDASGVDIVEYRIDQRAWLPLAVKDASTDAYSAIWTPVETDEGARTVSFRATDKSGNVSEPVDSSITVQPKVEMTGATDKASYTIHEDVAVNIDLRNIGWQKNVSLAVRVENALGNLAEELSAENMTLAIDELKTITLSWNTATEYAGNYIIRATLTKNGEVLTESIIPFIIEKALILDGSLTLSGTSVPIGEPVTSDWTVTNNGNFDLSDLVAESILSDEAANQLMNWPGTVTIVKGQTASGSNTIQTGDIGLGNFSMALLSVYEAENIHLADAQFEVIDITAPVVAVITPTDGTVVDNPVEVAAQATDDASGVVTVEYRIDQREWQPLSVKDAAEGSYAATWTPVETNEGARTVSFRATDKSGNVSEPVVSSITVQPKVEMTGATDKPSYTIHEDVYVNVSIRNIGWQKNVSLAVRVENALGNLAEELSAENMTLAIDELKTITLSWNTATEYAGNYIIRATLTKNGEVLTESIIPFVIEKALILDGSLTLSGTSVPIGEPVTSDWTVTNNGNFDLSDLVAESILSDEAANQLMSWPGTVTIVKGQTASGSNLIRTDDIGLGSFSIALRAEYESENIPLANAQFKVIDITPPVVSITSPTEGTVVEKTVEVAALVTDDASGMDVVEYRIDQRDWQPLPVKDEASGSYAAIWTPVETDEGVRTVSFRAADKSGNVSEPVARAFSVQPKVELTAATGKASYTIHEDVAVDITLQNIGWLKNVQMTARIENARGETVAELSSEALALAADEQRTVQYTWNTATEYAGDYKVHATLTKNGAVLTEATVPFVIEKALVLSGSLTMSNTSVPIGDDVTASWSVINNGNLDLNELAIEHILSAQDEVQLMSWPETVALAKGQSVSGSNLIQTGDIGLGSYSVALKAVFETEDIPLAEAQFAVIDITAPVIEITSPTDGTVVEKPVEVAAQATDDASGVDAVEYRIDQGDWLPLLVKDAATGTYSAVWTPVETDEGDRTVSFRATDKSGNVSEPVVSALTVQPKVELTAGTNKSSYTIHEDVAVDITLRNIGWLKNVQLAARIENARGETVAELASEILVLAIDEQRTIQLSWNTATEYAGDYNVYATLTKNGVVLTESINPFVIEKALVLNGNLALSETSVPIRDDVTANWAVINNGNFDLNGLVVESILSGQDGAQLMNWSETVTIAKGQTVSGSNRIQTGDIGLGSFSVALRSVYESENIPLAEARFEVIDITPPVVSITSPADGTIVESPVEVAAQVTDDVSGVDIVEYRIDQRDWLPLSAKDGVADAYSAIWTPVEADEGSRTVSFRATDKSGNISEPVVSSITVQPKVDLTAVTDKASYAIHEDVTVDINLRNIGWQKNVKMTARIENALGETVAELASEALVLTIDEQRTIKLSWNTATEYAGSYKVHATLTRNGVVLTETTIPFVIEKALVLDGSLTLSETAVPVREAVTANWTVTNNGNIDLSELVIENILSGLDVPAQLQQWTATHNLAKGQAVSGSFAIQTADIGLGGYLVELQAKFAQENITLAAVTFAVIDITPPEVSIIAPAAGSVAEGPIEISALATDDASGVDLVEYRIDQGEWQPLSVIDAATGTYSAVWTPVETDEGDRTVSFRGRDLSGNISAPVSVSVLVELCKPFAEMTGTLTVLPDQLYYSQDLSLEYTLSNQCNKPLDDLGIRAVVIDPATGLTVHEASATSYRIEPRETTAGSFDISSLDLEIKGYTARLEIYQDSIQPRIVAETPFTVHPAVTGKNKLHDTANLLVWLNNGQQGNGAANESACMEECASSQRLEAILDQAMDMYTIVCSRPEFELELRNPLYTDIMIIGDQHKPTDHHIVELREKVHSGAGLIALGFDVPGGHLHDGTHSHHEHMESFLGIKVNGNLNSPAPPVILGDSPVTEAGELQLNDRIMKIDAAGDTIVAGWIPNIGTKKNSPDRYPAIVLHEYGLGRTVYTAFGLCDAFSAQNDALLADLLIKSIGYVHRPDPETDMIPYLLKPYDFEITGTGLDLDLTVNGTCSEELVIYDPVAGSWIEEDPWTWTFPLRAGETVALPYSVLAPDAEGVFTCTFDAGTLIDSQFTPLDTFLYRFTVSRDKQGRLEEAINAAAGIAVTLDEEVKRSEILQYLQSVLHRTVTTREDTALNILEISKAVNLLISLDSDVDDIRMQLDALIRLEQARYYLYE